MNLYCRYETAVVGMYLCILSLYTSRNIKHIKVFKVRKKHIFGSTMPMTAKNLNAHLLGIL